MLTDFHGDEAKKIEKKIRLKKTEMGQIFDDYPGFQTKTTPA